MSNITFSGSEDTKVFIDTFLYARSNIPKYITNKITSSYDFLTKMLLRAERELNSINYTTKKGNFVRKLLLGLIGYESNQQNSIYELPTFELIATLATLFDFLKIDVITEIYAGCGLISEVLRRFYNDNYKTLKYSYPYIMTYDGKYWLETSGIQFCDIPKKDYFDILIDKKCKSDAYLCCWGGTDAYDYIDDLFKLKSPKCVVLIGEHDMAKLRESYDNYYKIDLYLKQICFRDHIYNFTSRTSHSRVICYIRNDLIITKEQIIQETKLRYNLDDIELDKFELNHTTLKNDLIGNELAPRIIRTMKNEQLNDIIGNLGKFNMAYFRLPSFLETNDEIYFWIILMKNNLYPKIESRQKFIEFYNLYSLTLTDEGMLHLRGNKIVPYWIEQPDMARKFITVDYLTESYDKVWKTNYNEFTKKLVIFNLI